MFYEGPPTANGRPGIHHVFSRTIKDLVCRFQAMQGKSVTRIAGWDTHGLPVEIEVEKELDLNGKKDIEKFGVEEFNALCRGERLQVPGRVGERSPTGSGTGSTTSIPTSPARNDYIESVWWLLARLHERGPAVPRAPGACPIARAAAPCSRATSWRRATSRSRPTRSTSRSRWRATRRVSCWCGPRRRGRCLSNVAVAVNPELEYGEYRVGDRSIILATSRASLLERLRQGSADVRGARCRPDLPGTRAGRATISSSARRRPAPGRPGLPAGHRRRLRHRRGRLGDRAHGAGLRRGRLQRRASSTGSPWCARSRPTAPSPARRGPRSRAELVTARETNDLIIQRLKHEGRWHLDRAATPTRIRTAGGARAR